MSKEKQLKSIGRLLEIMDDLREKCPWDKKQTFESLKPLTIEETFELADAISENNIEEIKNELGDLYKVTLTINAEGTQVTDVIVTVFDTIQPASSLCITRNGLLFAATVKTARMGSRCAIAARQAARSPAGTGDRGAPEPPL